MAFSLPRFHHPDFEQASLRDAPVVQFKPVTRPGVAPDHYHATSIFPEYFQIAKGCWRLLEQPRMDCVAVLKADGTLTAREFRHLKVGDRVACGRGEGGEDGIYVHSEPFENTSGMSEKFAFRTRVTRETSFSIDYDELYELLPYERDNGFILWVLGPATVFDWDARAAFVEIIKAGFVHGLLAGNALAVHDVEGALFKTALGQELYSKRPVPLGHYKHLDAINEIRKLGSLAEAMRSGFLREGVLHSILQHNIPYVLAGSIRDDGPLPDVLADVTAAQDRMRDLTRRATTVIGLATQLHTIATGNMVPSYHVLDNGDLRPVYFYIVDMSEFAADKLANRGSLAARSFLTNVQDFMVTLERGLRGRCR